MCSNVFNPARIKELFRKKHLLQKDFCASYKDGISQQFFHRVINNLYLTKHGNNAPEGFATALAKFLDVPISELYKS